MKRTNNIILIVVLVVLAGAFALSRMFHSPRLQSNFQTNLLKIDTANVTQIRIDPAGNEQPIILVEEGKQWKVQQGEKTAEADNNSVTSLLGSVTNSEIERMVSRKEEKWNDFNVGDSTGTHIELYNANDRISDWWVGGGSGSTYVRLDGEDEVYATAGYLNTLFNKKFDAWRNKSFLHLNPASVSEIAFHYPSDSSFVVVKMEEHWMIGDQKADTVSVQRYLNKLRNKTISSFADDFSPSRQPDMTLTIQRASNTPLTVKAWKKDEASWVLTSSYKEGTYFSDTGTAINDLFVGRDFFFK